MDARSTLDAALAGHYTIERELGQGGMATVYLARDLKHDRNVAIKVLKPELGEIIGPERFLREIKTTANLRHPHIVPLYDSGNAGPLLYYVMPFVEGESLRDRMDRDGQLPVDDAIRITREVAGALEYAHAHGVIHRDIKPENIMLDDGHAVVADFGIARALSAAGAEKITQTGISLGTPMYMSPEQTAGGGDLDSRTDEYSLACVCFEMLGGQPPFTGPTAAAITRQHMVVEAPPISNLRAGAPPAIVAALKQAMAKDPVDRFGTLKKFSDALTAAPLATRRAPRAALVGIAAALIAVVALGIWKFAPTRTATASVTSASIAVLPFSDLSLDHSNAFIGDGVAETLINALANVPGLNVAARASAFAFRDKASDLVEITKQLRVANVLEGSVQRAGDQLRITAQVIRTSDGKTIWSQKFDRPAADIFAVQDEVARAVINALQLKISSTDSLTNAATTTHNPAAYDAYMLGRYHWNRRTTDGMIQATAAFQKAVSLDSLYALAWSGLADAYVLSIPHEYDVPGLNPDTALTRAERAARRAIALAPAMGEAYASLGEILDYRNKFVEGGKAFERAVALSPGYATAHQWYSYHLADENRWDESLRAMETAHRLDPLSHVITLSLAMAYDGADRFADATPLYAQGLAQSPEAWYAWSAKVSHELALGRQDSAFTALKTALFAGKRDSARENGIERALKNPTTRAHTIDSLAFAGHVVEAFALSRWILGDEATIGLLGRLARFPHEENTSLGFYIALGPKLRALPRVQALGPSLGWVPVVKER